MTRPILAILAVASMAVGGLYAFVRLGGDLFPDDRDLGPEFAAATAAADRETHRVTPAMLDATESLSQTRPQAPPFRTPATDGVTYSSAELAAGSTPVVLAFIKDGCPCSSDAQRFFNRLQAAYGRDVRFLGVIDADSEKARAWGRAHGTTFPLLLDPTLDVTRAYHAESSAYVAVIDKSGTLDHLYPGYSAAMLAEAGDRIARLAGVSPRPIDASGAPEDLITGCPFDLATSPEVAPATTSKPVQPASGPSSS